MSIEDIRASSGDREARWIERRRVIYSSVDDSGVRRDELTATRILEVGGLYLVENEGDPDNWYMGTAEEDGTIHTWVSTAL